MKLFDQFSSVILQNVRTDIVYQDQTAQTAQSDLIDYLRQGYRTKLLRAPPGSLKCSGPRFNVAPERQFGQPGIRTTTCSDPKHCVHEFYALPTEL